MGQNVAETIPETQTGTPLDAVNRLVKNIAHSIMNTGVMTGAVEGLIEHNSSTFPKIDLTTPESAAAPELPRPFDLETTAGSSLYSGAHHKAKP